MFDYGWPVKETGLGTFALNYVVKLQHYHNSLKAGVANPAFGGPLSCRFQFQPCPRESATVINSDVFNAKLSSCTSQMSSSYCPTSYSWEKRRASLALSRSMWSANSQTDMGGCSLIPKIENKTTRSDEHNPEHHTWCSIPLRRGVSLSVLSWGGHDIKRFFLHLDVTWSICEICADICCVLLCLYPKHALDFLSGGVSLLQIKKSFPATASAWERIKATCSAGSEEMLSLRDVWRGKGGGVCNREDSSGWGWMSKTEMLNGTWLGMIPHYEFIMPIVSTVMSGRAPCQLLHAIVTARQWVAGSGATLLINRTDAMPKNLICCILVSDRIQMHFFVLQHTEHVNIQ